MHGSPKTDIYSQWEHSVDSLVNLFLIVIFMLRNAFRRILIRLTFSDCEIIIYTQTNCASAFTDRRFSRLYVRFSNLNMDTRCASVLLHRIERLRSLSAINFQTWVDFRYSNCATYLYRSIYFACKFMYRFMQINLFRFGARTARGQIGFFRYRRMVCTFITLYFFSFNSAQTSRSCLHVQMFLFDGTDHMVRQEANT